MMDWSNTRREFLGQAAAVAAMAGVAPSALAQMGGGMNERAKKPLDLLMLGGTGFLGPHIVWRAIERGHNVTLFNRGQTEPDLFPDLEHIQGDRYSDLSGLESTVSDGRTWDGAIDTFAYVPSVVTDMMDVVAGAVGHYSLVSTVSVYADSDTPGADESAPLAEVTDEVAAGITSHREVGANYGAMKARCERAGEAGMPGRIANIRAGLIVGARDTTGRFSYWPIRASEGGTMIGPGDGSDPSQVIDVRDLANFIVLSIEKKLSGEYNAISGANQFTIKDIIDACVKETGAGAKVEWVASDFLEEHGVNAWQHMPCWVPITTEGYAGFGQASVEKALAAGMTIRPLAETVRGTMEYYTTRGPELEAERGEDFGVQWRRQVRGGLDPIKESEVLQAWMLRGG